MVIHPFRFVSKPWKAFVNIYKRKQKKHDFNKIALTSNLGSKWDTLLVFSI